MSDSRVMKHVYPLAVLVLLISAAQANQQEQKPRTEQVGLFLGAGLMVQDKPLKGVDAKVYPLPFYLYRGKAFSTRGLSASYEVFDDENWAILGLARFRTDGYHAGDSSDLDGMSDRRNSLDLGAELSLENSWGNVDLDWVTDALGEHDGHEARLNYVIPFRGAFGINELGLRPMWGLNWRSENLNNYYYGVHANEATADRTAYKSESSVNPYAGVAPAYQLAERWSIFSLFRNEWLGNEITDSPIIDQDSKPEPLDFKVGLRQIPTRRIAAIRYSGSWSRKKYETNKALLEEFVRKKGLQITGQDIFAKYYPPFQIWFLKRNEVLFPVE